MHLTLLTLIMKNFHHIAENDMAVTFLDENLVKDTFFVLIVTPANAVLWSCLKVRIQGHYYEHFNSGHMFTNANKGTHTCCG